MSSDPRGCTRSSDSWRLPVAVSLAVAAVQLSFIAFAGTDMPLDDQWDVEGGRIYPRFADGSLRTTELFEAHNEHRLVWTHLLNLALFAINGQWDPIVQLIAIVGLRAGAAGILAAAMISGEKFRSGMTLAVSVVVLFLPLLAWHNVICGFQTQVYFCLGFSLLSLWILTKSRLTIVRVCGGVVFGVFAQLGMSGGAFVAVAMMAVLIVRVAERSINAAAIRRISVSVVILIALALLLRQHVADHDALRPTSLTQFAWALGTALAWPYTGNAWVSLIVNTPFAIWVARRFSNRRQSSSIDDFVLAAGVFSLAGALAQALFRGAAQEFRFGVPSRYTDFLVPLVVANVYCLFELLTHDRLKRRKVFVVAAAAWVLVVISGWVGSSAQVWHLLINPRIANITVPTTLVRSFQLTDDPQVFAGYKRLFVPHPAPASSIGRVLKEPRLNGKLPPSLQPEAPVGPLSQGARWVVDHHIPFLLLSLGTAAALVMMERKKQTACPLIPGESARA